ncbi:sortase A [Streptomyces sp. PanSC19]|uniref:class E sortase n=1 Tax=Streptomyces sp. PanSC19 TaxID=1520455 RepID=UPI000FBB14A7|nr:class E sortase [Streptomyces sp. PanSC19]ROQ33083.1 sortase A [Streptomyces sp. PanSC19]
MTTGSPWFRPSNGPGPEPITGDPHAPAAEPHAPNVESYAPNTEPYAPYAESYTPNVEPYAPNTPAAEPYAEPYAAAEPYAPVAESYAPGDPYAPKTEPYVEPYTAVEPYATAEPYAYEEPVHRGGVAQEGPYEPPCGPYEAEEPPAAPPDETMPLRAVEDPAEPPSPGPGRAERRRAAKGGRGRTRGAAPATASPSAAEGRPLSRVEARRAARAAKESVGVVASRVVGELFITFGVVMLLFVTYQLWWTNIRAGQETDRAKAQIEDTWAKGDDKTEPGAFEPGKGFAIMYIPKLDVVVPVAEGISKTDVLDKGMVGHYGEGKLKTAMPADKQGNFAVAGHRNTHGEPFRYINRLKPGDPIVVETQSAYYTYEMASILPQTSPSNVSVIEPVPKQSGFKGPGRYITLTTCTPEFTSTYRMIVWGRLVDERPRSKGKPEALVG